MVTFIIVTMGLAMVIAIIDICRTAAVESPKTSPHRKQEMSESQQDAFTAANLRQAAAIFGASGKDFMSRDLSKTAKEYEDRARR